MSRRLGFVLLVSLSVGLVGCDHATKALAVTHLEGRPAVQIVPGVLDLAYTENPDVAFSLLRSIPASVRHGLIVAVDGLLVLGLAVLWLVRRRRPLLEQLGYAMVLAGAVGNLAGRIVHGYVVDFIYLHHWPVFNVADMCIDGGAALLIVLYVIADRRKRRRPPPEPAAPA